MAAVCAKGDKDVRQGTPCNLRRVVVSHMQLKNAQQNTRVFAASDHCIPSARSWSAQMVRWLFARRDALRLPMWTKHDTISVNGPISIRPSTVIV
jgi:hypothetical protein